jgi:hypothetical protein
VLPLCSCLNACLGVGLHQKKSVVIISYAQEAAKVEHKERNPIYYRMWYTTGREKRRDGHRVWCHHDARVGIHQKRILCVNEETGGQQGWGGHISHLTETADWAMLDSTSRTSEQHGIYLALSV